MDKPRSTMAGALAVAASDFERRRTGHVPESVSVILSGDTLVIALHETLSPAEKALVKGSVGAARVQEFHRQLFNNDLDSMRREIKRITGVEVREATTEVETATGAVGHVFTSGTMVEIFLLDQQVVTETWHGVPSSISPEDRGRSVPIP